MIAQFNGSLTINIVRINAKGINDDGDGKYYHDDDGGGDDLLTQFLLGSFSSIHVLAKGKYNWTDHAKSALVAFRLVCVSVFIYSFWVIYHVHPSWIEKTPFLYINSCHSKWIVIWTCYSVRKKKERALWFNKENK